MSKKRPRGRKNTRRVTKEPQRKSGYIAALVVIILLAGAIWLFNRQQPVSLVTPEVIAAEIIPHERDATGYGIPLSLDNTQRFIDYYETITLTPEQEQIKETALRALKAPCCDDNPMSTCCCPCNLAKSVWGLSAYLIVEENYNAEQVRDAALQWLRFIHSDYYVMRELENRGVDPGRYGMSYEAPCYNGYCELPHVDGGCGGMEELKD